MTLPEDRATILVDSHCHLHKISDLPTLLQHAGTRFKQAADDNNIIGGWYGVLVLTDGSKSTSFRHIQYMVQSQHNKALTEADWQITQTEENSSLVARNRFGQTIFICAGQQIVTKDKLEVLSLLETTRIPDGKSTNQTLEEVVSQGGLPVLPWGVGKWLGKRGKLVSEIIAKPPVSPLFLGDNSGRPPLWAVVPQFKQASQKNMPILRGTDPLAVKEQKKWGGDFGFIVNGLFDPEIPCKSLKEILSKKGVTIQDYGKLEKLTRFFLEQIGLRLKK